MISTIFGVVKQQLEKTLRALGQEQPTHHLGAWNLDKHEAPPRIVWEPMGGPVTPTRQASADGRREVRQIGERHERCRIQIWDKDFTATETLMNHFVAAARAVSTGFSFSALRTDWLVQQAENTGLGILCNLEIELRIPFTAEPIAISKPPHPVTINGAFVPQ